MTPDRKQLAIFWSWLGFVLERAARLIGKTNILSPVMRTQARRLLRMAEYMFRRLIVLDALARLASGDTPPDPVATGSRRNQTVRRAYDPDQSSGYSLQVIEPLATPRNAASSSPSLKPEHGRHDLLPEIECVKLRNRMEGLQRLIARRDDRTEKLMAWFASRGPRQHCTPWRWARCPFLRHRDYGDRVRQLVDASQDAVDAFYEDVRGPPGENW